MNVKYVNRIGSGRLLPVDNTTAGQVPHIVTPFSKVIKNFDLIIEIGYYWGGLTLWFNKNKKNTAKVIGYDITKQHLEVTDPTVDFRIGNCFDPDIKKEIFELVKNNQNCLIFCDGGNKKQEFIDYAPCLKTGDVIMVHDYYDDSQPEPYNSFPESEGWLYGCEVTHSDIKETIQNYNLNKFHYEDFRRCIIGSFVKE